MNYPDRHHPCFFLEDALTKLGAAAKVVRDETTQGCWGLVVNGKRMVWLIDNRHPHEALTEDPAAKRLLDAGVLVCHAQKPDAERVGGKWLPLAVSPMFHAPSKPIVKIHQVGMVGYVRDTGRMQAVSHVARHFQLCVAQGVFNDEALNVYWQSEVGLNVSMGWPNPTSYDLNMRFWEIMATGTPLVTNELPAMNELGIKEGSHCLVYQDADEMIAVIQYLIDHPVEACEMGEFAKEEVSKNHMYINRAKTVMNWLGD